MISINLIHTQTPYNVNSNVKLINMNTLEYISDAYTYDIHVIFTPERHDQCERNPHKHPHNVIQI